MKAIALIFSVLAAMSVSVHAQNLDNPPVEPPPCEAQARALFMYGAPHTNCYVAYYTTNCTAGSYDLTNGIVQPTNGCLGSGFSASASLLTNLAAIVRTPVCTNLCGQPCTDTCPEPITNRAAPTLLSIEWEVTGVGADPPRGSGLNAPFRPTACGTGRVTFRVVFRNDPPCERAVVTNAMPLDFNVIQVAITGESTALINRCVDSNRTVLVCVADPSCVPGGVTWTLSPMLTDGATINGVGDCALVAIGNVATNYTITATYADIY